MKQRIKLPAPVAAIYRAVAELEATYPLRKFTPDGVWFGAPKSPEFRLIDRR